MLLAPALLAGAARGRLLTGVVFSHYGPASSNLELARRLLSPAEQRRIQPQREASGAGQGGQPVDLAAEKFIVYVPSVAPVGGYAVLVFIPPWERASLPQGWQTVLDRNGAIFVSAARSGNEENPMGRRAPLALLAAENIIAEYPVNPQRVYIAGFSGGARMALRLAVGYPELFRGAILNAGSDSLGDPAAEPSLPPPPRELFYQFQSGTRLVYVTGEHDAEQLTDDMLSMRSMRQWCVFNVDNIVEASLGHEVAPPAALSRALDLLEAGVRSDAGRLAQCRSAIEADLESQFRKASALIASGDHAAAEQLLKKIDRHFGALAAARSLELAEK